MRIPIRNKGDRILTLFIEVTCHQFEIPVDGEAIVHLEDGRPHSIDVAGDWVTIWHEGNNGVVEIISSADKRADDALSLPRTWLHRMGAEYEASLIGKTVDRLEITDGYLVSRQRVFDAFYDGFASENGTSPGAGSRSPHRANNDLNDCYLAGITAGRLNRAAREANSFPELGAAPLDTDTAQSAFKRALSHGS